jgi:hypothetical protein
MNSAYQNYCYPQNIDVRRTISLHTPYRKIPFLEALLMGACTAICQLLVEESTNRGIYSMCLNRWICLPGIRLLCMERRGRGEGAWLPVYSGYRPPYWASPFITPAPSPPPLPPPGYTAFCCRFSAFFPYTRRAL